VASASSTSAPGYVVTLEQLAQTRRQRHGRNLFIVDLAVPRDVDPRVADLDGVFLYNVDDLAQVANTALADRRREAEKASTIVGEETDSFLRRSHAERITPTLVALRERFRATLEAELERRLFAEQQAADRVGTGTCTQRLCPRLRAQLSPEVCSQLLRPQLCAQLEQASLVSTL